MTEEDFIPPQRHPRLWLMLGVGVLALAAIYVYIRAHRRPAEGRIVAEIFYLSVAPVAPGNAPPDRRPISAVRVHYFVRNIGTDDYAFPAHDKLEVLERDGIHLRPGAAGVKVERPDSLPAGRQAELVIERPYTGEWLPLAAWTATYPQTYPGPAGPKGTYHRMAVPVVMARELMKRDSLTPDQLLGRFDVIADGPTRECTQLARAILRRRAPRLNGFVLIDHERNVRIDCPLPPG